MKTVIAAIALSAIAGASSAAAQVMNLSGQWQCVAQCLTPEGGFARITQNGWDLILVNEAGVPWRAWIDYPGHIWIDAAHEGAIYSPNGFSIKFDHGTVWQRAPQLLPPVRSSK